MEKLLQKEVYLHVRYVLSTTHLYRCPPTSCCQLVHDFRGRQIRQPDESHVRDLPKRE